eukprot:EG_transcript_20832
MAEPDPPPEVPREGVYTIRIDANGIAVIEPGRVEYEDGSTFEGGVVKGQRSGKGTMRYSTGEVYEGAWVDNVRCGQGTLTSKGGSYTGSWKDDRMHGRGAETFANGATYEGEYVDGKMHGMGVMKYPNGNVYEGWDGTWQPLPPARGALRTPPGTCSTARSWRAGGTARRSSPTPMAGATPGSGPTTPSSPPPSSSWISSTSPLPIPPHALDGLRPAVVMFIPPSQSLS